MKNEYLRHPASRRLALHVTGTRDAVLLLMNRMGRALGHYEDGDQEPIGEREKRKLLADVDATRDDVPRALLASAANVLMALSGDDDGQERQTMQQLADEQGTMTPLEASAKLATLITRILDRRIADHQAGTASGPPPTRDA